MAWRHLADLSDFADRQVIGRECDGRRIALYRVDGCIYATSNLCTHAFALLSEGEVVEGFIECPLHYGLFEIATGRAQGGYVTTNLKTYPVSVEDGMVLVQLDGVAKT